MAIVKWKWNDGMGSRRRRARCFVVANNGDVHWFDGKDIPGVVKVLGEKYEANGKWSNTDYRCISPYGTVPVCWMQDWDTGETFTQDTWEEAFDHFIKKAPNANFESFEKVIREKLNKIAVKFDSNRAAIEEFGGE